MGYYGRLELEFCLFFNKLLRCVPRISDFILIQKQAFFSGGHQDCKFFFSLIHFDITGKTNSYYKQYNNTVKG